MIRSYYFKEDPDTVAMLATMDAIVEKLGISASDFVRVAISDRLAKIKEEVDVELDAFEEEQVQHHRWANAIASGDFMTVDEYRSAVRAGAIIDCDGSGYAYDSEKRFICNFEGGDTLDAYVSAEYVIWFNK